MVTPGLAEIYFTTRAYRKSHILISAGRQHCGVVGAKPIWPQDMHGVLQLFSNPVHIHADVRGQPGEVVHVFSTDGLQRGFRHRLLDIVLRRSVRAQAPRHAHFGTQPVLLRRFLVRDHVVRCHGGLEAVRAVHLDRTACQHCRPVQGKRPYLS